MYRPSRQQAVFSSGHIKEPQYLHASRAGSVQGVIARWERQRRCRRRISLTRSK